jgi:hypothetical protein
MGQLTFAEAEYEVKKRKTRREKFLERIDSLLPWKKLERQLAKEYSASRAGRKPYPLKVMLRVHLMQLLYDLSDLAMEDALYEIESMRCYQGGLRVVGRPRLPGESNLCCRSRVGIYEQDNDSLVSDRCGMPDLPGVCGVSEDRRMLRCRLISG